MTQDNVSDRIRVLFLDRKESYTLPEVAHLAGTPARRLRREVAGGYRDASKVRGLWRFTWRQAVCFALECWTLAEIHCALGADAEAVLPALLTLRAVTVRLPEYIVRALETVAAESGTTFDAAMQWELIDFAGSHSERMEAAIPGYRRAYLFPGHD